MADVVEVDGKKIVVADQPGLSVAWPMNRAERRRFDREQGNRGTKAKRQRSVEPEVPQEVREALERQAAQEKVQESARNIRDATRGRFWLPGDNAR